MPKCVLTQSKSIKYFYDKGDFEAMKNCFKTCDWEQALSGCTVYEMWEIIHNQILAAVDKFVPHRRIKTECGVHKKPLWMNEKAMSRIKRKKTSFHRYKETREGKDYLEYVKARNAAKTEIRKAVRGYEKEVAKLAK